MSVFMGSSVKDVTLNEYTVYRANSKSSLVNYKIKEDVKDLTNSTVGVDQTTGGTTAGDGNSAELVDKDDVKQYWEFCKKYGAEVDIDPLRIATIITIESTWQNGLISSGDAKGLMQMIDDTFASANIPGDVMDPETNIHAGSIVYRDAYNQAKSITNVDDKTAIQSEAYYYANRVYHQGFGGFQSGKYRDVALDSCRKKQNVYEDLVSGVRKVGEDCSDTYARPNAFVAEMEKKR